MCEERSASSLLFAIGIVGLSAGVYGVIFWGVLHGRGWNCAWATRVDWASRIVSNIQCAVSSASAVHILVLDEAASQAYWDAEAAAFGQSSSRELCMLLFVR